MADNILRLRVESKEYDSKIERARQGLLHLENELRKVGQNFSGVSKEQVEFVRSIGQMSTVSQTARGKINELTKAFTDLSMQYKQLSNEEKNSPFGQAMASSLDQLRTRIQDSRQQLDDINGSLKGTKQESQSTGNILEQLAGKFGLNITQLTGMGAALAAVTGAVKVVKDAFLSNEENLDDWGRTVESSKSLYEGFLYALNNGDISGFLANIDQITQAAREAYDAIDELQTFNAFNQINVEKTRTGMTESIADYREGSGTKEQVRAAGAAYKNELEERKKLENDAYLAAIKKVASQRGVNASDLQIALSGTYGSYQMLKNVQPTGSRMVSYGGGMFGGGGYYMQDVAVGRQEKLAQMLRQFTDDELNSLQAIGAQAQRTGNEIANVDKQISRILRGKGGGGTTSGGRTTTGGGGNAYVPVEGSIDFQAAKVQELQKAWRAAADDDSRQKIKKEIEEAQFALDILTGKTSGIPEMNYGVADLAGSGSNGKRGNWKLDSKAMAAVSKATGSGVGGEESTAVLSKELGNIGNGISSLVGGVEQLGFEIPQEMKNVINGIQTVTSILSGIATIITTIQAISAADAIIPFATGGIVRAASGYKVPGRHFSNDQVPALLNSGELVLNRAQQGALASSLTAASAPMQLEAVVSAEQIRFVLNNNARRRGRGEYLTIK